MNSEMEVFMKLEGSILETGSLSPKQKNAMYLLKAKHYDNASEDSFYKDLSEKNYVVLLVSGERIIGFTTVRLIDLDVMGQPVTGLFSGDTIVDPDHAWELTFQKTFVQLAARIMESNAHPLYWFLISKGYKTYRYLPLYFKEFYPSPDRDIPAFDKAVMDVYASYKYPEFYNSDTGVIRNTGWNDFLKKNVADVSTAKVRDPFVDYFIHANPGYDKGDELVCLARIATDNLQPAFRRMLRQNR